MEKRITRKNRSHVRNNFFNFFVHFFVLLILLFSSIYLFFKSYTIQRNIIHRDIVSYKEILNKQQVLKSKFDNIYYQISLLGTKRVENEVFLQNYISENIQQAKDLIGNDSISEFKCYSFLFTRLDSILLLKNEIIVLSKKESFVLRKLNDCMGKMVEVKKELSKDLTRVSL